MTIYVECEGILRATSTIIFSCNAGSYNLCSFYVSVVLDTMSLKYNTTNCLGYSVSPYVL